MNSLDQTPQFTTAQFRDLPADSHALFMRGLLFGAGGALIGLILYAAVGIITGLEIGYVSLAVGFIVAKAILMGSRGRGGRRYQIAAIVLTYMAVSVSAVPIGISQIIKDPAKFSDNAQPSGTAPSPVTVASATPPSSPGGVPADTPEEPLTGSSILAAVVGLLFIGLVSPFLGLTTGASGLIGLVILAIGLRIAWRMTGDAGPDAAVPIAPTSPLNPQGPLSPEDEKPTSLNLRG